MIESITVIINREFQYMVLKNLILFFIQLSQTHLFQIAYLRCPGVLVSFICKIYAKVKYLF